MRLAGNNRGKERDLGEKIMEKNILKGENYGKKGESLGRIKGNNRKGQEDKETKGYHRKKTAKEN